MNMNKQMSLIEADFKLTLVACGTKAAMKDANASSRDLWQVPIDEIRVIEGLNPRVMTDAYKAHIRALADSMISEGFFQDQPLAGYTAKVDGKTVVYIYGGHTRLVAAKLANSEGAIIERLPIVVNGSGLAMEDITVSLIRGNGGKPLTYYESAVVCKRLVKYGFDLDEIAKRTGITVPMVKNRLALMAAPLKLREMVANDELSATLAIDLLNTHGDKVLDALDSAKDVASAEGKTKVRKAQAEKVSTKPDAVKPDVFNRAKYVKRAAPKLFEAADLVCKDPGFANLSPEIQELLTTLLSEIRGDTATGATQPQAAVHQAAATLQ